MSQLYLTCGYTMAPRSKIKQFSGGFRRKYGHNVLSKSLNLCHSVQLEHNQHDYYDKCGGLVGCLLQEENVFQDNSRTIKYHSLEQFWLS